MALIHAYRETSNQNWVLIYESSLASSPYTVHATQASTTSRLVKVWDDSCEAYDQGDGIAEWLTKFLGVPCRLFRMTDSFVRPVDLHYSPEGGETAFSDGFPFLLISDASLADLNKKLEQKGKLPVTREHFRSVLWADDCEPFAEDAWKRIRIGSVVFDVVKPCARCVITKVIPTTGEVREDKEPLATLAQYRTRDLRGKKGAMFGQNLVHRNLGIIRLGDEVEVLETQ